MIHIDTTMKFRKATLIALMVFCLFPKSGICSGQQFSKIADHIDGYLKEKGVPAVAVAIAWKGKIIWEQGFGLANIQKQIPATAHTRFPLASITKNLTATALMCLVEQGKVNLDRPVNEYLGDTPLRVFRGEAQDVTLRRILQHTAGLPLYYDAYYEHQLKDKMSLRETIRRFGIVVSPPGKRFAYSSMGYGIVEYVIETISKSSYRHFLKKQVFEPLAMESAGLFDSSSPEKFVALEYTAERRPTGFAVGAVRASGDVYCSAHDLIRYALFHLKSPLKNQRALFSNDLIDKMQKDFDDSAENGEYALGWRIENVGKYRMVSHNGGGLGSDTRLAMIPSEKLAVVVLANSRSGNSTFLCDTVMKHMLPDFRRPSRWERYMNMQKKNQNRVQDPPPVFTGDWYGEITTFKGTVPVQLSIKEGGRTFFRIAAGDRIEAKKPVNTRARYFQVMLEKGMLGLDPKRPEKYLLLILEYKSQKLYGSANAGNSDELIYCVPSYIELIKKK